MFKTPQNWERTPVPEFETRLSLLRLILSNLFPSGQGSKLWGRSFLREGGLCRGDPVITTALLAVRAHLCLSLGRPPCSCSCFLMAKGSTGGAESPRTLAAWVAYRREGVGKEKQNLAPLGAQAPKPPTAWLSRAGAVLTGTGTGPFSGLA